MCKIKRLVNFLSWCNWSFTMSDGHLEENVTIKTFKPELNKKTSAYLLLTPWLIFHSRYFSFCLQVQSPNFLSDQSSFPTKCKVKLIQHNTLNYFLAFDNSNKFILSKVYLKIFHSQFFFTYVIFLHTIHL